MIVKKKRLLFSKKSFFRLPFSAKQGIIKLTMGRWSLWHSFTIGDVKMISRFENLINSLVWDTKINNSIDTEDVKQELRMKLMSVMPDLIGIPEDEIYKVVKVILKNKVRDIIRYSICRPDGSMYSATENIDSVLYAGAASFCSKIESPEKTFMYRELITKIVEWADSFFKHNWEKDFIRQLIAPSDDVLAKYDIESENNPRVSGYSYFVPTTLGRAMGLSQKQVGRIIYYLRQHLESLNYSAV